MLGEVPGDHVQMLGLFYRVAARFVSHMSGKFCGVFHLQAE
jgi:hypothetical protein